MERYTNEIIALMSRTTLDPLQRALDFTEGLQPKIKGHVLLQDCQDLEHCIKAALAFERSQRQAKLDRNKTFVQYADQSRGT